MRATWVGLGLILACGACGGAVDSPSLAVQDSAGVQIVTNVRPDWGESEAWTVADEPLLSIGSVGGDASTLFDRVSSVVVLPSGELAVLDEGAGQIRLFDGGGRLTRTLGRSGQGPGEFQGLAFVGLSADSLWVFDGRQQRLTVWDPSTGEFRVAGVGIGNAAHGPAGLTSDATVILVADMGFSEALAAEARDGLQRFSAGYVTVGSDGVVQDTMLVTDGSERILVVNPPNIEMIRPLLARSVSHAVRGSELIQGTQADYEFGVYSADGGLTRLIRRSDVDVALDEASYRAAVEERVSAAPEPARPGLRRLYEESPRPAYRPAYSTFLVDSEGVLWVQDFSYVGEAASWAVYDEQGVWLGSLDFPEGFSPTYITADRIAGIWRDELGVEYARIYALQRR